MSSSPHRSKCQVRDAVAPWTPGPPQQVGDSDFTGTDAFQQREGKPHQRQWRGGTGRGQLSTVSMLSSDEELLGGKVLLAPRSGGLARGAKVEIGHEDKDLFGLERK